MLCMYRMDCPGGLVWGTLPIPMVWVLWQLVEGSCMLYILSPFPLTKVGVGRVTTKGLSAGQSGCVSHVLAGYSQAVDTVLYSLDWLQPSNLSHQRNWFVAPFCPNPVPTHFTLIALSETPSNHFQHHIQCWSTNRARARGEG